MNSDMTYCNSTTCDRKFDCDRNIYNHPETRGHPWLSTLVMDESQEKDCELFIEKKV